MEQKQQPTQEKKMKEKNTGNRFNNGDGNDDDYDVNGGDDDDC